MQADDQSCQLQLLLDRIQTGDPRAGAELINLAYDRLRRLTRKIFHQTFPHLRGSSETASVLDQAALELLDGLQSQEITVSNVQAFFRDAARKIRNVLRRREWQRRRHGHETLHRDDATHDAPGLDPACGDADPARAAMWAEFHDKVEQLPDDLLRVVDLHFYNGLTEAETAYLLGVSQPQVSRLWKRAQLRMVDWLPDAPL